MRNLHRSSQGTLRIVQPNRSRARHDTPPQPTAGFPPKTNEKLLPYSTEDESPVRDRSALHLPSLEREEEWKAEGRRERKRNAGSQPKMRDVANSLNSNVHRQRRPLNEGFPTVSELAVERSVKRRKKRVSESQGRGGGRESVSSSCRKKG